MMKFQNQSKNTLQSIKRLSILVVVSPTSCFAATLSEAAMLALDNNLLIESSKISLLSSEQNVAINRAKFFPSISISANTTWNESNSRKTDENKKSEYNSHGYSISFSQTLFSAVDAFSRTNSLLDYSIQKLQVINTRQQVIYDTCTTYVEILKTKAQIRATEQEVESAKARLKQINRNIELGNMPKSEIYEVKAQKLQIENDLRTLKKDLINKETNLSNIVNMQVIANYDLNKKNQLLEISKKESEDRHKHAIENNIEVLISGKQIHKSKASLASSIASFTPTITTSISYSHNDTNAESTDPNDLGVSEQISYSLNANLPIFNGGSDYHSYQQSSFDISKAKVDLQNKINEVSFSVKEAIMNINNNAQSLVSLNSIIETNRASYLGIRKAYKLGTRTVTDLLAAESKLYNSIRDYESAKYAYLNEMIKLLQLEGRLDMLAINNISNMMEKM